MPIHRLKTSPSPRSAPRLVARLYCSADLTRRGRMLACLLQPLGVLSVVAVAAGAFRPLLGRRGVAFEQITPDSIAAYSSGQILELARFVQDVDPDALWQVSLLIADTPWALTAFSATVILLLRRALRPSLAGQPLRLPSLSPPAADR